jgi:hypothetical protein
MIEKIKRLEKKLTPERGIPEVMILDLIDNVYYDKKSDVICPISVKKWQADKEKLVIVCEWI